MRLPRIIPKKWSPLRARKLTRLKEIREKKALERANAKKKFEYHFGITPKGESLPSPETAFHCLQSDENFLPFARHCQREFGWGLQKSLDNLRNSANAFEQHIEQAHGKGSVGKMLLRGSSIQSKLDRASSNKRK